MDKVQHSYDLLNDYGIIGFNIKHKGLSSLDESYITLGVPVNSMLAIKLDNIVFWLIC